MQCLSLDVKFVVRRSVHGVSQNRMTDRCHVHPDLVRPSSLELELTVCISVEPLKHTKMSDGRFSGPCRNDGHFLSVAAAPAYISFYFTTVLRNTPENYCAVAPCD